MKEMETIVITFDDGEEVEFYVLEQTKLMGVTYYMVAPSTDKEDEGDCYILKEEVEGTDTEYGTYTFVDDQEELENIFPLFVELLEDSDTEVEF